MSRKLSFSEEIEQRREKEKQERINSILDAALKLFAEKGYYHTRMDDIAAEALLGKGTLYYYFRTKEELYFKLLKREEARLTEELSHHLNDNMNIEEFLITVVNFFIEYFSKHREYISILFPLQSGLISIKDETLLKEIEKLKGEFQHIRIIKEKIERIVETSSGYDPDLGENLLYFLGTLIKGIGDFIKIREEKMLKKSLNSILKKIRICEDEYGVD